MRDNSVFVNVSRGAIVQTDALIARLRDGRIVAALDVFDPEPIPEDSPIRDMRNVFLTPHTASATKATRSRNFTDHGRRAGAVLRRARDTLRSVAADDRQPDRTGAAQPDLTPGGRQDPGSRQGLK